LIEWARGLLRAEIKSQLACSGAQLTGTDSDGNTLVADGMKAGGDVFLTGGFTAAGVVRLRGVDITSQLGCRGAELTGTDSDGNTLVADGMKVGEDVFLDGGFTAAGAVSLNSTHVGGSVLLAPAALAPDDRVALDAARAQISGKLRWAPSAPVSGQVNLEGATVGQLEDNWGRNRPNGYWPADGRLHLDGFTYGRFGGVRQSYCRAAVGVDPQPVSAARRAQPGSPCHPALRAARGRVSPVRTG
jgi:hypothetical protein